MSDEDDLPAEIRRQDEEAELQVAAQLAELRKDTDATDKGDLPAEVRRQDEEAELREPRSWPSYGRDTGAIRYVDLGPAVPMWRVGYYKEHGGPYVFLVTLEGPRITRR